VKYFSNYYKKDLEKLFGHLVPPRRSVLRDIHRKGLKKYDYILLPNTLAYEHDVQSFIKTLKNNTRDKSKIVVVYFNFLWRPLLSMATKFGFRKKDPKEPNWLGSEDISNFFYLENFHEIKRGKRFLFPVNLGLVSNIINKYLAQLPLLNSLCLTTYQVFQPIPKTRDYSVSVIVPARNEEGHIPGTLKKIPKLGKKTEIIFVEGHSTDNTYEAIKKEISNNPKVTASLHKQKGIGKADAVRLGFDKAKNDVLMILDSDLTVPPKDLAKFYKAISSGQGELVIGTRLVYPMEKQAMRNFNYVGNWVFSIIFTYLLGQRINDTLCGTKVLLKKDYLEIVKTRKIFGDFDPFEDFELIFGASKLNLKITEIPIRYGERTYGKTNISRVRHGLLLIKMTVFAAKYLKYI